MTPPRALSSLDSPARRRSKRVQCVIFVTATAKIPKIANTGRHVHTFQRVKATGIEQLLNGSERLGCAEVQPVSVPAGNDDLAASLMYGVCDSHIRQIGKTFRL